MFFRRRKFINTRDEAFIKEELKTNPKAARKSKIKSPDQTFFRCGTCSGIGFIMDKFATARDCPNCFGKGYTKR